MTKSELKIHLSGRKIIAVWSFALLLVGLVCFLMVDNFRHRLKLQRETQREFLHYTQTIASGLEYYFEERKHDLNMLASSRTIAAHFENQATGMSVESGLKESLLSVQESLDYFLKYKKIADHLVYQRFMLVGRDGKILLDCSWMGETPSNLYSVFNGKPRQAIDSLNQDGRTYAVISVPCYLQEEYVASLLAIINTDSIVRQTGSPESVGEKNIMILDGKSLGLLNRSPYTEVSLSILREKPLPSRELFTLETENQSRYLFANVPIQNTPFRVINSAASDRFNTENPWEMLSIMALLAAVLFGCGIYVYHSAAGNLILQTRLDEKNSQQQALEQINLELQNEVNNRRYNEILLNEKEAILLATIDATTEGILVVNPNEEIVSWNPSFRDIWKFQDIQSLVSIDEMKDIFLERTQHCESFINEFCALQDTTELFSGILTLKNGFVVEYAARPMKVGKGIRGRVWTFRDITIHKCAEKTLQLAKEAAEKSNKSKSEFLANMSHELRTPLNSVIGFSEVLQEETLNESQKAYVENIYKSGINLLEMLDNLLLYSDIEAGRVTREVQKCALCDMVNIARKRIRGGLLKKSIHLDVIYEKDTPSAFYSDPYMVTKVLIAVLDNACKFTDQGQIVLTVSQLVENFQPWIQFEIKDTGIGIPEDKLKKLFDTFSQVDGSMSRKYGGMGTGLTLVKRLVGLLGGKVQVQSEYGKGTTITITLPNHAAIESRSQSDPQNVIQTAAIENI